MKPRKPGLYQCRVSASIREWQTREVILGDNGELRIIIKDGTEKLYGDGPLSMGNLKFEWRELKKETNQLEMKI